MFSHLPTFCNKTILIKWGENLTRCTVDDVIVYNPNALIEDFKQITVIGFNKSANFQMLMELGTGFLLIQDKMFLFDFSLLFHYDISQEEVMKSLV